MSTPLESSNCARHRYELLLAGALLDHPQLAAAASDCIKDPAFCKVAMLVARRQSEGNRTTIDHVVALFGQPHRTPNLALEPVAFDEALVLLDIVRNLDRRSAVARLAAEVSHSAEERGFGALSSAYHQLGKAIEMLVGKAS